MAFTPRCGFSSEKERIIILNPNVTEWIKQLESLKPTEEHRHKIMMGFWYGLRNHWESTSHVTLKSFSFSLLWLHSVWHGGPIFPPPDKPTCTSLIHSLIQFLMAAIFPFPFHWELSSRVPKPWGTALELQSHQISPSLANHSEWISKQEKIPTHTPSYISFIPVALSVSLCNWRPPGE